MLADKCYQQAASTLVVRVNEVVTCLTLIVSVGAPDSSALLELDEEAVSNAPDTSVADLLSLERI